MSQEFTDMTESIRDEGLLVVCTRKAYLDETGYRSVSA